MSTKRSNKKITKSDLKKLSRIALDDLDDLYSRNPNLKKLYKNRLICIALCQGAALHYVDKKNGVKDFDVWSFFSEVKNYPFPYRRNICRDFGPSKFGFLPKRKLSGRPVDLLGRSLKVKLKANPSNAVQEYLLYNKNKTPRLLSKKAVVLIYPYRYLGKVIWYKGCKL